MTKPALEHHKILLQPQPGRALHIWLHFQGWTCTKGVPRSAGPSEKLLKAEPKGKARLYPLVLLKKIHVWITYLIRWTWLINPSPLLRMFEVLDAWISKCDSHEYLVEDIHSLWVNDQNETVDQMKFCSEPLDLFWHFGCLKHWE